jgi:glycogen synthase
MQILLSSHAFSPDIGGIETVSALLARAWTGQGHSVEIITQTQGPETWEGLMVHRRPTFSDVRRLAKAADFVFQSNLSLRTLLPAFEEMRKTVILHQTHFQPWGHRPQAVGYLKRLVSLPFTNLAISNAVAKQLPRCRAVVGNLYDDATFRPLNGIVRDRDLIFVGRLVSDKGVDVLLRAMHILASESDELRPNLTIVGDGPERSGLQGLAHQLDIASQVTFAGKLAGADLVALLHRHRVLVVPSIWPEPFGLVALEGAACGCFVVGSDGGGLPDAIGPCGMTFRSGDPARLALAIVRALARASVDEVAASRHLERFTAENFAEKMLSFAPRQTGGKI